MAALDTRARRHPSSIFSCFALLLFIATLFLFSALRRLFSPDGLSAANRNVAGGSLCNYTNGKWIRDQSSVIIPRYDSSCKEIFKGWNCISSGKSNARDLLQWRWKPLGCDLLPLDPVYVLRRFRNKSIGFVGDSLNRNMFVSLLCMLRKVYVGEVRKWRPAGADRGFTFVGNNLTVAYHRTNLMARYGSWSASPNGGVLESLGFKQGYRVDVDVPEHSWVEAPLFHDIIIFNTGHWWWARSKFDPIWSPMLFFEKGMPVVPPLPPDVGLGITLKHMVSYIETKMRSDGVKFFLTQSPRHFEGGDWNQGGSCRRVQPLASEEVENFFSLERNGTNVEVRLVNRHLLKALKRSSFHILDITHMTEFRADAHPSTAGGKKHEDCMHWCLPGLTDTWVDLLMVYLENLES